jgi:hypothetical protein
MLENLADPVVLCFVAGLLAGLLKSDLKVPQPLYESLSLYLLLAIGLTGGVKLAGTPLSSVVAPAGATLGLGVLIPLVAFGFLRALSFGRADAAAIAAHYGSVSAVTFAIVLEFCTRKGFAYEPFVTVLLVVLEVPAIVVGILLARVGTPGAPAGWGEILRETFTSRSIYLLLAGLVIGYASGAARFQPVAPLFVGLFKGSLALFLLEMGLVVSHRIADLLRAGPRLVLFGVTMPILSGAFGALAGVLVGLSPGGTTVLATLAASASYIAAPAAMRIAVPEANPSFYLGASLGVTFPFNVVFGIPIYHAIALSLT